MSPDYHEIVRKVITYINERDFFWIHELKAELGVDDLQTNAVLHRLRQKKHIKLYKRWQGSKVHYMVLSRVNLEEFNKRKVRVVKGWVKKRTLEQKKEMSERMINYHKNKTKNK